jgi:hypothetical protein
VNLPVLLSEVGVSFRDRNGSEKAEAAIAFVFSDFLISSNSPGDFAGTEGEAAAIAPPKSAILAAPFLLEFGTILAFCHLLTVANFC